MKMPKALDIIAPGKYSLGTIASKFVSDGQVSVKTKCGDHVPFSGTVGNLAISVDGVVVPNLRKTLMSIGDPNDSFLTKINTALGWSKRSDVSLSFLLQLRRPITLPMLRTKHREVSKVFKMLYDATIKDGALTASVNLTRYSSPYEFFVVYLMRKFGVDTIRALNAKLGRDEKYGELNEYTLEKCSATEIIVRYNALATIDNIENVIKLICTADKLYVRSKFPRYPRLLEVVETGETKTPFRFCVNTNVITPATIETIEKLDTIVQTKDKQSIVPGQYTLDYIAEHYKTPKYRNESVRAPTSVTTSTIGNLDISVNDTLIPNITGAFASVGRRLETDTLSIVTVKIGYHSSSYGPMALLRYPISDGVVIRVQKFPEIHQIFDMINSIQYSVIERHTSPMAYLVDLIVAHFRETSVYRMQKAFRCLGKANAISETYLYKAPIKTILLTYPKLKEIDNFVNIHRMVVVAESKYRAAAIPTSPRLLVVRQTGDRNNPLSFVIDTAIKISAVPGFVNDMLKAAAVQKLTEPYAEPVVEEPAQVVEDTPAVEEEDTSATHNDEPAIMDTMAFDLDVDDVETIGALFDKLKTMSATDALVKLMAPERPVYTAENLSRVKDKVPSSLAKMWEILSGGRHEELTEAGFDSLPETDRKVMFFLADHTTEEMCKMFDIQWAHRASAAPVPPAPTNDADEKFVAAIRSMIKDGIHVYDDKLLGMMTRKLLG